MRTRTPRPPPAKALRNSRFNHRFSSRCDLRPSPALFAPPPRKINTIALPHSTPHAHHPPSAHFTMDAPRHTKTRARRSKDDPPHDLRRFTSSPTSSEPNDTNPQSTGVPSPAGRHACGAASVGPAAARARPVRMLQVRAHEAARVQCPLPRLPDSVDSAPASARRHLRLSIGTCERARRLACFADGFRVALPVQAAAAASARARRPPRPRHLRHDRQARRRQHGHEDPAAGTPAGSAAWPRRRGACHCETCEACEPGAFVLETATPSALCIPSAYATPSSSPHTPHTQYHLPHSSPLQLERPATAEVRSSCLRAAIARQALICTNDLIGGIPGPFLGISIALFQPSTSTYVGTSLYDRSDCSDASSD
jgi:hypothetical protein